MNISLLFSNISARQSKSTVQQQMKGSATKIPVPSLDVIESIIKVWVASTWTTKEQQLTILIVNLQLDFIYLFFSFFFLDLVDAACVDGLVIYNMMDQNSQGIGGMDLVNQGTAAYHLDCGSLIRFYLPIFFVNLMGIACVNAFIIYNMMHRSEYI